MMRSRDIVGAPLKPIEDNQVQPASIDLRLGDYAYPELSYPDNAALASAFATLSRQMGRDLATPQETRSMIMAIG